jgi:hypothetical protein
MSARDWVHPIVRAMRFKGQRRRTQSGRTNALLSRSNEVHCRATPRFLCFFSSLLPPRLSCDDNERCTLRFASWFNYGLIVAQTGGCEDAIRRVLLICFVHWQVDRTQKRYLGVSKWPCLYCREVYITECRCVSLSTFLALNEFIYKRMPIATCILHGYRVNAK